MKPHTPESIAAIRAAVVANALRERPVGITILAASLHVSTLTLHTFAGDVLESRRKVVVASYSPKSCGRGRYLPIPGPQVRLAGIRMGDRLLHRVLGHGAILTRVMRSGEVLDGVGEPWNGGL